LPYISSAAQVLPSMNGPKPLSAVAKTPFHDQTLNTSNQPDVTQRYALHEKKAKYNPISPPHSQHLQMKCMKNTCKPPHPRHLAARTLSPSPPPSKTAPCMGRTTRIIPRPHVSMTWKFKCPTFCDRCPQQQFYKKQPQPRTTIVPKT